MDKKEVDEIPLMHCAKDCHAPQGVIAEINRRLNEGDGRFVRLEASLNDNTIATQKIADNTSGLVQLATDLQAGTKFLCRVAMGIRFILKDVVEPFWRPTLIVFVVVYVVMERRLPEWIAMLFKAAGG